MFNEHPNCSRKWLDSLNVQWTSKLFHGQTSWFPTCSMNMQIVMEKSLDSLNVQWTSELFHGQTSWFPKCSMNIQIVMENNLVSSMFNDHPNCLMKKARTFLNSQWKFKLFGQNAEFPECSMNIQIVWWKNHWHSYMPNENPNCLMGKSRAFLNVQWTSKLFHGKITWFPKCSMNIQIVMEKSLDFPKCLMNMQTVSWKNHLIS